jgi:sugar phosphate isomerase/epimerase
VTIAAFLARAAALASDQGIVLTLEHLHPGESNVFNTVAECAGFLTQRDLTSVGLTVDLYHLMMADESLSVIAEAGGRIRHTHVADTARDAPGTGQYPWAGWFDALASIHYQGDCSIEAWWTDFDAQVGPAVRQVRSAAQGAGIWTSAPADPSDRFQTTKGRQP